MRTLESAEPPGPVAVIVYVVASCGLTVCVPCAVTAPIPGERVSDVALVDDHVNVDDCPRWMKSGEACMVTVGRAGGGAAGGGGGGGGAWATGFLQAEPRATRISRALNRTLACVRVHISSSSFDDLPDYSVVSAIANENPNLREPNILGVLH
jgi:hypothetical protein